MKKSFLIPILIFFILITTLIIIRAHINREIDDVSPNIPCEQEQKYLKKADILWVIPKFTNKSISENPEWCEYILSLNKTLGMHGITHEYREFKRNNISQEELEQGIKIFEECFGFKPTMFKSPQLRINKENKELLKQNDLRLRSKITQFTHKVYHCNNGGINPDEYKITDIFKGIVDNRISEII
ncbi:MAG: DUF2334 domain-containing protein [Candidatus Pacearchaeota archaeon]|jgi:peptidoglycan/xylan/chitin deacetylase (PgdA/CDA1 family)